jgi:hypothetical protein
MSSYGEAAKGLASETLLVGRVDTSFCDFSLTVMLSSYDLDGLVEDAIETLDEGDWIFERNAFEKESLVEK